MKCFSGRCHIGRYGLTPNMIMLGSLMRCRCILICEHLNQSKLCGIISTLQYIKTNITGLFSAAFMIAVATAFSYPEYV